MQVVLLLLAALAEARIVTLHQVVTPSATTVEYTQTPDARTVAKTVQKDITVFTASTSIVSLPAGSTDLSPISSKSAPVTQTNSYETTGLSQTIDPTTYTSGFVIVNSSPTTASAAQTATSSAQAQPTSTSSGADSIASALPTSAVNAVQSSSANGSGNSSSSTSSTAAVTQSLENGQSTVVPVTSSAATSSASSASSSGQPAGSSSAYYPDGPIFDPIDTSAPLSMFPVEPIPLTLGKGVVQGSPLQTNKFYANTMLNGQNLTIFAQPYDLFWSQDENYYGLGIQYTNASQRVYGQKDVTGGDQYYLNPLMLKSFVFSAAEFSADSMSLSVSNQGPFSVDLTLSGGSAQVLTPIAIGMGFVTAIYKGSSTPVLFSQLGVQQMVLRSEAPVQGMLKYTATLFNGLNWNIYVSNAPSGFELSPKSSFEIIGNQAVNNLVIQVAVVPPGGDEASIDKAAGAYPTGASIDGEVSGGNSASYSIVYETSGSSASGSTLLYALPHHVASFSGQTREAVDSSLILNSPTKSYLTGVVANTLQMQETLDTTLQWLVPQNTGTDIRADVLQLLASVVNDELAEDMVGQTDTTSTYTAGKGFDKFAYILLVASEILQNDNVTKAGLESLQSALAPWLRNQQPTPFIYDSLCKGVTSSAANSPGGSPMDDFGAPFYNDHHFHYGYYVHTAAVIAYLDQKVGSGQWLAENKDWVNSLVRDVANPSSKDIYFPVSRMFDYYSGHSWAHGMFESGDGKDEESTSEDYNFAYGMKLWGKVSGDHEMEARGDLMLAIMKRSMDMYFYYKDDNKIQPSDYIANRVAGITFENKLDHTTYFGTNLEYIQGIHMIPLTGASVLMRDPTFVQQEWNSLLAPIVGGLQSGWAGILRANQALFSPTESYNWFAQSDFSPEYLDGGASRSWYLAYAALLGAT